MKLLVVDDAVSLRKRLVSAVGEINGVQVVAQAGRAWQAVERFRIHQPDVVTLDIRLPGPKNGIHLLETIKQEAPATVVMIFTNHGTAPYRDRCLMSGADYFFNKHTDLKKLLRTIKTVTHRPRPKPKALTRVSKTRRRP